MGFILVVIALGVIYCIHASHTLLAHWIIKKTGLKTTATVIRTKSLPSPRGPLMFFPVLQYTVDGLLFEVDYNAVAYYSPKYANGDVVHIYYSKKTPKKIMLPDEKGYITVGVRQLLIGLLFIVFTTVAYLIFR